MSVLCCSIPEFTIRTVRRSHPELVDQPLALLDDQGRVAALSNLAHRSRVQTQMTARQAQMRCPDIRLYPLSQTRCDEEQATLVSLLAQWELPVEEIGWGKAYIDLKPLTARRSEVKLLSVELGQRIRNELGELLQPALGWDSSKFTARAAAHYTQPGHIRLVDKADESRFLHNLSIQLLPLSANALQQLQWMGIRTLGQFAELPANAVRQRFGKAGLQAQQWAKGQDTRPVQNSLRPSYETDQTVQLDPPSSQLEPVLQSLLAALNPLLGQIALRMEGLRRLQLSILFENGELSEIDQQWLDPIGSTEALTASLIQQLQTLSWPGPMMQITITQLETSELPAHQMTLFPDLDVVPMPEQNPVDNTESFSANQPLFGGKSSRRAVSIPPHTQRLRVCFANLIERHGPIFWRPELVQTNHPVAERRAIYVGL